ncbi:MAG: hypothetical protein KF773_19680 [Deltaproteobacteria bacterium]|nr:hypothetical protein [Deltaproteobacteria bacterium]
MRMHVFTVAALLGATGLASASPERPITAGFSLGMAQSRVDAAGDANNTIGLWGRLQFTPRVSGQLELMRISADDGNANLRTGTLLFVIDLAKQGRLMPVLLAGLGLDHSSDPYGLDTTGHHIEGGLGLEYRANGGLTFGIDARLGGRTIDSQPKGILEMPPQPGTPTFFVPSHLSEGEYRQVRATLGVRF